MTPRSLTPNELAHTLGVTGLQFRNWLRDKKAAGHPVLVGHIKHQRYEFSRAEADQLLTEYRTQPSGGTQSSEHHGYLPAPVLVTRRGTMPSTKPSPLSEGPGHMVQVEWMGKVVTTLEDLLRPDVLAVVVGINPAPPSVAAGHYWQGNTGRTLWRRLRAVGLLPTSFQGYEDDAAFTAGVGFTDVVKRPTASAAELSQGELRHGLADLRRKLVAAGAPLVIFAFKKAATTMLGDFDGHGFIRSARLGTSEAFVMPGPYEKTEKAQVALDDLQKWVQKHRLQGL